MPGCSLVCRFCGQQANKKSIEKHLAFLVKSSPVPYACLVPSIRCQKMDLTLFFSSPNLINLEYNRWAKWNNLLTVPMLTSLAASLPEHKHFLLSQIPVFVLLSAYRVQSSQQLVNYKTDFSCRGLCSGTLQKFSLFFLLEKKKILTVLNIVILIRIFLIKILMVTVLQSCFLVIFIKELLNTRLQKVFVVTHSGKSNSCPLEGVCVVLQISGCVFAIALDYRDKQQHLYVNQVVKLLSCTLRFRI